MQLRELLSLIAFFKLNTDLFRNLFLLFQRISKISALAIVLKNPLKFKKTVLQIKLV